MIHPATQRAVNAAINALGVALDVGIVFPPRPGEDRGYGQWTNRDLGPSEIAALVPRLAAANSRGGNIYVRLGPGVKDSHPSMVMIDDLTKHSVAQLSRDGLEPCLVVETSSSNFQAWVRLIGAGSVPYATMTEVARHVAATYGGDPRAVSPRQPGRLPGFTNRKPKHQLEDGRFPFVRLVRGEPGRVATSGGALLERLSELDTARAAAGAAPETPRIAAGQTPESEANIATRLEAIHVEQRNRILREVADGRRPARAGSASEVDFATARAALAEGFSRGDVGSWLARKRDEKDLSYSGRTVVAASAFTHGHGVRWPPR
jgi:hypothetical protein